jgi:hypothetical protein
VHTSDAVPEIDAYVALRMDPRRQRMSAVADYRSPVWDENLAFEIAVMDNNSIAVVPNLAIRQRSPGEMDVRMVTGGLTLNIRLLWKMDTPWVPAPWASLICTSASSGSTVTRFRLLWDLPLVGLILTAFGGTLMLTSKFGKSKEMCGTCSRPVRCGQKPQLGNDSGFLRNRYHASGCALEEEVCGLCDNLLCRERRLDRSRGDLQLHICKAVE